MGVSTDFFVCNNAEFERVLEGWQLPPPPLREPVQRPGIVSVLKQLSDLASVAASTGRRMFVRYAGF